MLCGLLLLARGVLQVSRRGGERGRSPGGDGGAGGGDARGERVGEGEGEGLELFERGGRRLLASVRRGVGGEVRGEKREGRERYEEREGSTPPSGLTVDFDSSADTPQRLPRPSDESHDRGERARERAKSASINVFQLGSAPSAPTHKGEFKPRKKHQTCSTAAAAEPTSECSRSLLPLASRDGYIVVQREVTLETFPPFLPPMRKERARERAERAFPPRFLARARRNASPRSESRSKESQEK